MKTNRRFLIVTILVFLILAIPTTVLANKKIYTAKLSSAAELHDVVQVNAVGSAVLATNIDGTMRIQMQVRGLSGAPTGAHLHAPATTAENAGVVVTLCGAGPSPKAASTCPFDASTSTMTLTANFNGSHLQGVTGSQFMEWLDAGLIYINVHTALNPAGEARGQLNPR